MISLIPLLLFSCCHVLLHSLHSIYPFYFTSITKPFCHCLNKQTHTHTHTHSHNFLSPPSPCSILSYSMHSVQSDRQCVAWLRRKPANGSQELLRMRSGASYVNIFICNTLLHTQFYITLHSPTMKHITLHCTALNRKSPFCGYQYLSIWIEPSHYR